MAMTPSVRCHDRRASNAQRPSPRSEGRLKKTDLHLFGKGLACTVFDAGATGAKPEVTIAS
jgi:hypothetical protein